LVFLLVVGLQRSLRRLSESKAESPHEAADVALGVGGAALARNRRVRRKHSLSALGCNALAFVKRLRSPVVLSVP
jgi:hypothetical protein